LKARLRPCFILAILFSLALPAFTSSEGVSVIRAGGIEYLPLDEMISFSTLEYSFDMISQKGKLYRKDHHAVYSVGLSTFVVDGALFKSSGPVCRKTGRVLIPLDAGEFILKSFRPGMRLKRVGDVLYAEYKPEERAHEEKESVARKAGKDRISFIVIDPGHGGKDPGAVGKGGLEEKEITQKVARYLQHMIKSRIQDIRVLLTRSDDRFVELSRRTEIANRLLKKNENGIFLSIHVNSSLSSRISGYETFFLSQNPTNEDARNTAALENNVIILEEKSKRKNSLDDVDYIEAMMITTQIQKESSALASSIQEGLAKKNTVFASRGVKKADFFVLRGVLMPAVLIEVGYISNKKEAQYLQKESHRKIIADGIAEGVEMFIKKYNSLLKVN
jgi:N-acetylmuramoyl-L-alanine amidase